METKPLVPKLRFPEFRDAPGWEQRLLGSEALFFKGRGVSKADIDPNGSCPCIRYGELYTRYGEVIDTVHSRTSAPKTELFLSSKNDVIIPASGETKEDIATASCVTLDGVALGSDINVLRTNHNGVFLSYLINGVHRRAIAKMAQGDTVVHLYPSQLAQVSVVLPEAPEQQKIAECLTSLDELIVAEGRKLEALRTHKKGLMQNLFPREGETTPRLRFPEFRCKPDWERSRLFDLCEVITKGSTPTSYGYEYVDSGIRFVKIESLLDGVVSLSRTSFITPECDQAFARSQLKPDDILFSIAGALGFVAVVNRDVLPANINQALAVIRLKRGYLSSYMLRYFNSDAVQSVVRRIRSGAAQPNLSLSQLGDFQVLLPEPSEQHRIADSLASLDSLIAAQAKKIDTLKIHKQGLMQSLFPSPEGDE